MKFDIAIMQYISLSDDYCSPEYFPSAFQPSDSQQTPAKANMFYFLTYSNGKLKVNEVAKTPYMLCIICKKL